LLTITKPSTVYIKFPVKDINGNAIPLPRRFCVLDNECKLYFERFLNGKTPRIKFNIPNEGNYQIITPCDIVKIVSIEIPNLSISLPPFERDRVKDIKIICNPDLTGTPARIFSFDGIIEKGRELYRYPKPMRVFFLLHEVGHLYYKTEKFCDLFALVHFLQMGYNMSTAMYCLTNVLKRTPQNNERVVYIYNHLMKAA
jgi:hypothetical protein